MIPVRFTFATVFLALTLTLALSACAGKPLPLKITYDNEDFAQAVAAPAIEKPVRIVTVPEPLPLPGQLKPRPGYNEKGMPDKDIDPHDQVAKANDAARVEPSESNYMNAVQVYPYTAGALYQLYTSPGIVSDVALQAGEQLVAVSAGDTVRWVIGNTTSGNAAKEKVHIFVKPIEAGLSSNLVITTDRRTYHIEMTSDEETYMASLSWHYPFDELLVLQSTNAQAESVDARTIARGLNLQRLKFRYQITGDDAPWRPLRVFDDGVKVYIQFPRGIIQGEAPPLFVVGPKGAAELVNYRMRGHYYIVDRLFPVAELRLGSARQKIVRITRLGADSS